MCRSRRTTTASTTVKKRQNSPPPGRIQSLITRLKGFGHSHPATGYGLPSPLFPSALVGVSLQKGLGSPHWPRTPVGPENVFRSLAVYACLRFESVENTCLIHRAHARVTIRNSPGPFRKKKTVEGEDPWGSGCCTALGAWMRRTFRQRWPSDLPRT